MPFVPSAVKFVFMFLRIGSSHATWRKDLLNSEFPNDMDMIVRQRSFIYFAWGTKMLEGAL